MSPVISTDCSTRRALQVRSCGTPRRGSVVAWRGLEDDSLELGECVAAETKRGVEALESEFAGVEGPPDVVERRSLRVEYLLARSLQEDQVSRALEGMREAHVPFALLSVETLERQNDGLPGLQPLLNGGGEQIVRTVVDLTFRDPTG